MNENPLLKHVWESWLPEVGILLLFWVSRVWNILSLAAYIDEGILIFRIRDIERGRRVFVSLARKGKWLQPAGLSLLSVDGPETLWVMRFSSALLAMLACAACIGLGRTLASRGTGRLAGLFYILPALGFLHERTALADVWLSAFSALAMVAAARLELERDRPELEEGRKLVAQRLAQIKAAADDIPAPVQTCGPGELSYYPRHVDLGDREAFDLEQPQRMAHALAESLHFHYYDLMPVLQDKCLYQSNNMHWTLEGHQTVAAYLSSTLITDSLLLSDKP